MNEKQTKCQACDGCGKVANDDEHSPWTRWLNLPLGSSTAVIMGLVRPMTCEACNGTGRSFADEEGSG